jgi:hypothetical protein
MYIVYEEHIEELEGEITDLKDEIGLLKKELLYYKTEGAITWYNGEMDDKTV